MISEKQRSRLLSVGVNHHSTVVMVGIPCSEVDCQYSTTSQIPDESSKVEKLLCLQLHSQAVHPADDGRSWKPPYETVVGHGDGVLNFDYIKYMKWLNVKANEALRLADENVAIKKAASEKDEVEAEAAKEMHADSSAGSNAKAKEEAAVGETALAAKEDAIDEAEDSQRVVGDVINTKEDYKATQIHITVKDKKNNVGDSLNTIGVNPSMFRESQNMMGNNQNTMEDNLDSKLEVHNKLKKENLTMMVISLNTMGENLNIVGGHHGGEPKQGTLYKEHYRGG